MSEYGFGAIVRVAPHLIVQLEGGQEAVRLPVGRFTARTVRLRVDVAATPRLGTTLFVQGDNEARRLAVNARVHRIIRSGSDAYLVYNSAWRTGLPGGVPWGRPSRGSVIAKLVYYFRL